MLFWLNKHSSEPGIRMTVLNILAFRDFETRNSLLPNGRLPISCRTLSEQIVSVSADTLGTLTMLSVSCQNRFIGILLANWPQYTVVDTSLNTTLHCRVYKFINYSFDQLHRTTFDRSHSLKQFVKSLSW